MIIPEKTDRVRKPGRSGLDRQGYRRRARFCGPGGGGDGDGLLVRDEADR